MRIHSRLDITIALLLVCIGVAVLGATSPAYAISFIGADVHVLLILLGNDRESRDAVNASESKMLEMLSSLSKTEDDRVEHDVHLTIMKSENAISGSVTTQTLRNKVVHDTEKVEGDIITPKQVETWVQTLQPRAGDTVLVYYNGPGGLDASGTHFLLFDPDGTEEILDRGRLSALLREKPTGLSMLITDTSSASLDGVNHYLVPSIGTGGWQPLDPAKPLNGEELSEWLAQRKSFLRRQKPIIPSRFENSEISDTVAQNRRYTKDLFYEHEGFLDITAASPGEVAIGHREVGGHFTDALLSYGFTAQANTNNDDFLSWAEAFVAAKVQTQKMFSKAVAENTGLSESLGGQKTQEPFIY